MEHHSAPRGTLPRPFDPSVIRRPPRCLELSRRSEERLDPSRACVRAPGARQHQPLTTHRPPKRLDVLRAPGSELRGNATTPADRCPRLRRTEVSADRRRHAPCATRPTTLTPPLDPEGTVGVPRRPRWPREDAVPNVRAAPRLRRACRQGAERSERPRLSPSSTPGRSPEPEGSRSRLGCRVQTRGALPESLLAFDVTPKSRLSSLSR